MNQKVIETGIYEHYKGERYEVIGLCHHSETLEPLVIYRSLYDCPTYGNLALWVRPYEMFTGTIIIENKEIKRFKKL